MTYRLIWPVITILAVTESESVIETTMKNLRRSFQTGNRMFPHGSKFAGSECFLLLLLAVDGSPRNPSTRIIPLDSVKPRHPVRRRVGHRSAFSFLSLSTELYCFETPVITDLRATLSLTVYFHGWINFRRWNFFSPFHIGATFADFHSIFIFMSANLHFPLATKTSADLSGHPPLIILCFSPG